MIANGAECEPILAHNLRIMEESPGIIVRGLKYAMIDFQNEWLSLQANGEIRYMPPDLICILDPATGEPIRTDIVRYGYRGTVVLIPAHSRMRTERGIQTFGPRYFGYDYDYVPVEKLMRAGGI